MPLSDILPLLWYLTTIHFNSQRILRICLLVILVLRCLSPPFGFQPPSLPALAAQLLRRARGWARLAQRPWHGGAAYHIAQGHVEEEARGHREDPRLELLPGADRQGDVEAEEGREGAHEIEQQSPLDAEAGVEQSCEVSWGWGGRRGGSEKAARAWPPGLANASGQR